MTDSNERTVVRGDLKPTPPQVYRICRELCRRSQITFPSNRQQASELIDTLKRESAGEPVGSA